jgi:hypothetical protein
MTDPSPQYVTPEELAERLDTEVAMLGEIELSWWSAHKVVPFSALHRGIAHFVVAAHDEHIIIFADDEDEFGTGTLTTESRAIEDYGLVGDLIDAIRNVAWLRSNTSLERTRER